MNNNKEVLKAVDFFCGAGGMSNGIKQAGISILGGIDIDITCKQTYEINHPGSKFIQADIKKFKFIDLQRELGIKRNDRTLVFIGCSPCQYWTKMNTIKTKARDGRNLLSDFQRFVKHFRPGYVVIENVPGIFNKSDESPLPEFLIFLNKLGYNTEYKTINASHYGVPQHRIRFILIASRVKKIELPVPNKNNIKLVRDCIHDEKFYPIAPGHIDYSDFMHTAANLSDLNVRRLEKIKEPGGNRLAWKDDPELQIPAYKGNDEKFTDVYGRMDWNKLAPTLTTKFHSVSNGRFGHPTQNRAISLREGARLQTFEDSYIFRGSGIGAIARQIGNAVPPLLAKHIGIAINNSLPKS